MVGVTRRQEPAIPEPSSRTAAAQLVQALADHGVEYVFGVPGDTSLALYEALRTSAGNVKHVMARDERATSVMADVYARLTGRPGVCEAPSGAGALYLVPGVAEAQASSIPLLALTTDVPSSQLGRNVLTEMDQAGLFGSVTKWRTTLQHGGRAAELITKALRIATSGRCGAVQITLPEDVLEQENGDCGPYGMRETRPAGYPAFRTAPDSELVTDAAILLQAADRPLIIAGGGVRISGAWAELTELAELCGAPVGTSINGKGSIDEQHPLSIGIVGGNGARPYANPLVGKSDCVLFIGCKTDSVTTLKWTLPSPEGRTRIIQCDVDPAELGNGSRIDVGIAADARLAIKALIHALRRRLAGTARGREPWDDFAGMRKAWLQSVFQPAVTSTDRLTATRVFDSLRRSVPRESVLIADAGTPTPHTAALYPSPAGRNVIIPRGHGGLGYAIPGVAAAKLARPNAPVIGLTGDGSFGMAAGSLEVIARLDLPVTLLHFNNATFGWIRALQHFRRDKQYFGVDFSPDTDYVGIARGFGIDGVRAENAAQLEDAIRSSIQDRKSIFIDIVVASEERDLPPVQAWHESE